MTESNNNNNNKKTSKRRLHETARTPQLIHEQHPLYEYALKEYAQTVPPPSIVEELSDSGSATVPYGIAGTTIQQPHESSQASSVASQRSNNSHAASNNNKNHEPLDVKPSASSLSSSSQNNNSSSNAAAAANTGTPSLNGHPVPSDLSSNASGGDTASVASALSSLSQQQHQLQSNNNPHCPPFLQTSVSQDNYNPINPAESSASMLSVSPRFLVRSSLEEGMVQNVYYQEAYGDAYTGAPMKYVYPTGYQTMRPRSGPWRCSVFICLCFTWLSVFVVAHCSDQYNADYYSEIYKNVDQMENIEDDSLLIELRWCGSRPLYLMWLVSMLITGLSASYCGVIGYIKCRDFAVANSRSQPCGTNVQQVSGREASQPNSDYYLELSDGHTRGGPPASHHNNSRRRSNAGLYQSDGTPQFWGSQIYRPTQAAVAVTSR